MLEKTNMKQRATEPKKTDKNTFIERKEKALVVQEVSHS